MGVTDCSVNISDIDRRYYPRIPTLFALRDGTVVGTCTAGGKHTNNTNSSFNEVSQRTPHVTRDAPRDQGARGSLRRPVSHGHTTVHTSQTQSRSTEHSPQTAQVTVTRFSRAGVKCMCFVHTEYTTYTPRAASPHASRNKTRVVDTTCQDIHVHGSRLGFRVLGNAEGLFRAVRRPCVGPCRPRSHH